MKYVVHLQNGGTRGSRPARALWIEMFFLIEFKDFEKSRPARALWIEITLLKAFETFVPTSRPARALWIEISFPRNDAKLLTVEAREGLVD